MSKEEIMLVETEEFEVFTPKNPHTPPEEGPHVVVRPKADVASPWDDPNLCGESFKLAARLAQIMEELHLASWFNLQANGNWGLLPGKTPHFHVHIYGRKRTGKTWGEPVSLPLRPGTFHNDPMSEEAQEALRIRLAKEF